MTEQTQKLRLCKEDVIRRGFAPAQYDNMAKIAVLSVGKPFMGIAPGKVVATVTELVALLAGLAGKAEEVDRSFPGTTQAMTGGANQPALVV